MSAYFVTATGTDVGKTYVTAGILRAARGSGRQAHAIKPVMSGYALHNAGFSDAAVLLQAMQVVPTADTVAAIAPWRFAAALSPDMAAAREGREINFGALIKFCEAAISAAPELLLIEGVGGAMVPLTEKLTVLDWMAALNLPAILVTGSYLGTISHTLTTAQAILARGIDIAAVVLSESIDAPVSVEETALVIARFLPAIRMEIIPRNLNDQSFKNLAAYF